MQGVETGPGRRSGAGARRRTVEPAGLLHAVGERTPAAAELGDCT
jgi:hypothetical protein